MGGEIEEQEDLRLAHHIAGAAGRARRRRLRARSSTVSSLQEFDLGVAAVFPENSRPRGFSSSAWRRMNCISGPAQDRIEVPAAGGVPWRRLSRFSRTSASQRWWWAGIGLAMESSGTRRQPSSAGLHCKHRRKAQAGRRRGARRLAGCAAWHPSRGRSPAPRHRACCKLSSLSWDVGCAVRCTVGVLGGEQGDDLRHPQLDEAIRPPR